VPCHHAAVGQPPARKPENISLAVTRDTVARYPRRVQELLGYSIHVTTAMEAGTAVHEGSLEEIAGPV